MILTRLTISFVFCVVSVLVVTLDAEEKQPSREVVRGRLFSWLVNNVRDEPQKIAAAILDAVATNYGDNVDFDLTIGGTMTRTGKYFRLSGQAGQFIAIGLSKEQAEATGMVTESLMIHQIAQQNNVVREVPPIVGLSTLVIDHAQKMDARQEVTGSVKIAVDGNLPKGAVVRAIIPSLSKPYVEWFELPVEWKPGPTMIRLPRISEDSKGIVDPNKMGDQVHIVYVDVCTITKTSDGYTTNLLGNTIAAIVVFE